MTPPCGSLRRARSASAAGRCSWAAACRCDRHRSGPPGGGGARVASPVRGGRWGERARWRESEVVGRRERAAAGTRRCARGDGYRRAWVRAARCGRARASRLPLRVELVPRLVVLAPRRHVRENLVRRTHLARRLGVPCASTRGACRRGAIPQTRPAWTRSTRTSLGAAQHRLAESGTPRGSLSSPRPAHPRSLHSACPDAA